MCQPRQEPQAQAQAQAQAHGPGRRHEQASRHSQTSATAARGHPCLVLFALCLILLSSPSLAQTPVLAPSQAASLKTFGLALFGAAQLPASWLIAETITDPTALEFVNATDTGLISSISIAGLVNGTVKLPSVKNFAALSSLELPYNTLKALDASLTLLKNLQRLDVSHNKLSSVLPPWLTSCKKLTYLDLSYNGYTGSLTRSITTLDKLQFLFLQYNKLGAGIPQNWQASLKTLDISKNFFGGPARITFGGKTKFPSCANARISSNCFNKGTSPCSKSIKVRPIVQCQAYCQQKFSDRPCGGRGQCVWRANKFVCPSKSLLASIQQEVK